MDVKRNGITMSRVGRPAILFMGFLWLGWVQRSAPAAHNFGQVAAAIILITSAVPLLFRDNIGHVAEKTLPIIDLFLITVAVYQTGGAHSPLFIMYIPVIFHATLFWSQVASLQFTVAAALAYSVASLFKVSPIAPDTQIVLATTVIVPALIYSYVQINSFLHAGMLERERRQNLEMSHLSAKNKAAAYKKEALKAMELATIDPLTGLPNHGAFQTKLRSIARDSYHRGLEYSLLMIDIDNFKQVNDTFGHQFGDEVLREVAQALLHSVRRGDVLARYGGEEMAVVFPNCNINVALNSAERIHEAIRKLRLFHKETGRKVSVTVSIGASASRGDETTEAVIERADQALYEAKNTGKNKTVVRKSERQSS